MDPKLVQACPSSMTGPEYQVFVVFFFFFLILPPENSCSLIWYCCSVAVSGLNTDVPQCTVTPLGVRPRDQSQAPDGAD